MSKSIQIEKGQVMLILILVTTVSLAIGLSVIQKSLLDISTSTTVEESQRAFSAAEAGIELALTDLNASSIAFPENNSEAEVVNLGLLPVTPPPGFRQAPLQIGRIAKEEIVQVWLTDYTSTVNPPSCATGVTDTNLACYKKPTLEVFWGSSTEDKAALELALVYYDGTKYKSRKWYLDHSIDRVPANNFEKVACDGTKQPEGGLEIYTYQCYKKLGDGLGVNNGPLPTRMLLLRARLLYNSDSQPLAVQAIEACGTDCSLPPQQGSFVATGKSGHFSRIVKATQIFKVIPFFYDFVVFSAGEIRK